MRTDEELMLLFREGSREAFEELFSRYHRAVVRFAWRMTGDPSAAEEAAQETFLRIARAAPTYVPTAKFTTWMYTVARRATLNFLRDTKGMERRSRSFLKGREWTESIRCSCRGRTTGTRNRSYGKRSLRNVSGPPSGNSRRGTAPRSSSTGGTGSPTGRWRRF